MIHFPILIFHLTFWYAPYNSCSVNLDISNIFWRFVDRASQYIWYHHTYRYDDTSHDSVEPSHSAHSLRPSPTQRQSAEPVQNTTCSNTRSCSPDDGHNDARNMLRWKFDNKHRISCILLVYLYSPYVNECVFFCYWLQPHINLFLLTDSLNSYHYHAF